MLQFMELRVATDPAKGTMRGSSGSSIMFRGLKGPRKNSAKVSAAGPGLSAPTKIGDSRIINAITYLSL